MADTIKTNLGPVTAYADAKAHGYTGTREEFGQLLANAGLNLKAAETAKEGAEAAKQAAETSQQAAAENQKNAGIQAANAKASADSAAKQANAAKESAVGAANSATAAQKFETNAGQSATAASNAEAAAKQAQQAAETAKTDAEAAKTAAGTSADAAANSAADAKKTLESIPADYSALSGKVDENANGISELKEDTAALHKRQNVLVGSETGNPASCDDAFSAPLCGLHIYGKSTQDGTPTQDAPVPIVSAGDGGNVLVTLSDGNSKEQTLTLPTPNGLPGIPVTSGGNYTDQTGQQWVCDEIDLERGVKVQRVTTIVFSDKKKFTLRTTSTSTKFRFSAPADGLKTANLTTADSSAFCSALALGKLGGTWTIPNTFTIDADAMLYVRFENINSLDELQQYLQRTPMSLTAILATPIETPLSPAEIAAYKALTAYAPDTVVQASDGAGIKLDYQRDVNLVVKNLEDAIASMTTT
nr:MAG TPA: tail fiber protein [Caudoviricetes sp.]